LNRLVISGGSADDRGGPPLHEKSLEPRPESGLDCLVCKLTRALYVVSGGSGDDRAGPPRPLSSEFGTHKTVKARCWPWLEPFSVRNFTRALRVTTGGSGDDRAGPPWRARPHRRHTPHSAPCTTHPTPYTLHPKPETRNPKPETRHPAPDTRNPTPETLHPKP